MILYDKSQCPFCWRVRMALSRLGLDVERRAHDDPAWCEVWPALTAQGSVPVLVSGTLVLTDSRVILEYLDDRYGGLWPTTPEARARAREILCLADGALGEAARDMIFECRDRPADVRDPRVIEDAAVRWRSALPRLAGLLGEQDWFAAEVSITDYALATRFGLAYAWRMPMSGLAGNLRDWMERVFDRDEVFTTAPRVVRQWLADSGLAGRDTQWTTREETTR